MLKDAIMFHSVGVFLNLMFRRMTFSLHFHGNRIQQSEVTKISN